MYFFSVEAENTNSLPLITYPSLRLDIFNDVFKEFNVWNKAFNNVVKLISDVNLISTANNNVLYQKKFEYIKERFEDWESKDRDIRIKGDDYKKNLSKLKDFEYRSLVFLSLFDLILKNQEKINNNNINVNYSDLFYDFTDAFNYIKNVYELTSQREFITPNIIGNYLSYDPDFNLIYSLNLTKNYRLHYYLDNISSLPLISLMVFSLGEKKISFVNNGLKIIDYITNYNFSTPEEIKSYLNKYINEFYKDSLEELVNKDKILEKELKNKYEELGKNLLLLWSNYKVFTNSLNNEDKKILIKFLKESLPGEIITPKHIERFSIDSLREIISDIIIIEGKIGVNLQNNLEMYILVQDEIIRNEWMETFPEEDEIILLQRRTQLIEEILSYYIAGSKDNVLYNIHGILKFIPYKVIPNFFMERKDFNTIKSAMLYREYSLLFLFSLQKKINSFLAKNYLPGEFTKNLIEFHHLLLKEKEYFNEDKVTKNTKEGKYLELNDDLLKLRIYYFNGITQLLKILINFFYQGKLLLSSYEEIASSPKFSDIRNTFEEPNTWQIIFNLVQNQDLFHIIKNQ